MRAEQRIFVMSALMLVYISKNFKQSPNVVMSGPMLVIENSSGLVLVLQNGSATPLTTTLHASAFNGMEFQKSEVYHSFIH